MGNQKPQKMRQEYCDSSFFLTLEIFITGAYSFDQLLTGEKSIKKLELTKSWKLKHRIYN